MPAVETNSDAAASLALGALGWIVSAPERAERFLSLTGIDLATLRAQADDPALLAAAIRFLESHEPDLMQCADALAVPPGSIVAARKKLEE